MSLTLLAPLALLLGALLLGPVLVHLTRREPTEDRAFGLLFLLDRLLRRVQRRRQLHDRWLLLLRLLALGLVVLAVGQPELRWPEGAAPFGGSGRVIVVLDQSFSMDQREGGEAVFAGAVADAAAVLRGLPAGVQVAVVSSGGPATLLTSGWTDDVQRAAALVEDARVSSAGTDLHGALVLVRELLGEVPGEVLIYTDQSGPAVIPAAEADLHALLTRGSAVLPRVFGPADANNVVPAAARYGHGLEGGTLTVKLLNYGAGEVEVPVTVHLPEGERITSFVAVPGLSEEGVGVPGMVEALFTVPRQAEGGVGRVEVDDPALQLDNTFYFHLPRVGASRVMVVDGDPGSSPTRSEVYFVERALAPWGAGGVAVDTVAAHGIQELDVTRHRVVFLANVADPSSISGSLVDFVRAGGGLVIGLGDNVTADRYNGALGALLPAPLRLVRDVAGLDEAGVGLALPETQGVFDAFARGGREGFARVRVRRLMTVEPYREGEVETLLRTEDGVPVLLSRQVGTGRVIVWLSTLDLAWTNLPVQSVYVPMIQRMVSRLGGSLAVGVARGQGIVGEQSELEIAGSEQDVTVVGPDGRGLSSEWEDRKLVFVPTAPGPHLVEASDGRPVGEVAVNVPLVESDIRVGETLRAAQLRLVPDRLFQRKELGTLALLAASGLLLAAAAIAGGRHA